MRFIAVLLLSLLASIAGFAQRPRTVETSAKTDSSTVAIAPAPQTVKAKYEGGVFGHNRTMNRTLTLTIPIGVCYLAPKKIKSIHSLRCSNLGFADTQNDNPQQLVASHIPFYIGCRSVS